MGEPRFPISTYRLQLNGCFRFEDARAIVSYLRQLGISDIYTSPILKARRGSLHGYDTTDPLSLNPELGGEQAFDELVRALKANDMGLLLDVVPNHLAASSDNTWWMDVLENGRASPYAAYFDIDWAPVGDTRQYRVLLPILSSPYHQALAGGEIRLGLRDADLVVWCHDIRLPVAVRSYRHVISHRLTSLGDDLGTDHPAFRQLAELLEDIQRLPDIAGLHPREAAGSQSERRLVKDSFRRLLDSSEQARDFILENVALFGGKSGDPGDFAPLDEILAEQYYELAFWKTGLKDINYRRFFDVSDLIGVRTEDPTVFEATHALVQRLVRSGSATGLRIDHVDGLYDPLQYLSRLQNHIAPEAETTRGKPGVYIIVEKILSGDETLPAEWPVFGTTGYDFLRTVGGVSVDADGVQALETARSRSIGDAHTFDDLVYNKKRQVVNELFAAELHSLSHRLAHLAGMARQSEGALSLSHLTEVLAAVTASLRVYRTYMRSAEPSSQDRRRLEHAFRKARQQEPDLDGPSLSFLQRVLLLDFPGYLTDEDRGEWFDFVMRWQQFTGAVMAKGFEDTALYAYNRLVSLNEVGGNPGAASSSVEEFHSANLDRLASWPLTMNATSTHDTKRSEDVRARINVISEISGSWEDHLAQWKKWNQSHKQNVDGEPVPEPDMESLIYQTLIGAWPLLTEEMSGFRERFAAYVVKAAREAKGPTSWISANPEYERALLAFLDSILDSPDQNKFLRDFRDFQSRVAYYGALNSLAQVVLKATSPGVPDFYQGQELWDLSLVDPDNRRPVDFQKRIRYLDDFVRAGSLPRSPLVRELLTSWHDGRIKLYVTYKALGVRRAHRDLFAEGRYVPLETKGPRREHVCAFARCHGKEWVLTVVPRLMTDLVDAGAPPVGKPVWGEDTLTLPEGAPDCWLDAFTDETIMTSAAGGELPLSLVFREFPVALLLGQPQET